MKVDINFYGHFSEGKKNLLGIKKGLWKYFDIEKKLTYEITYRWYNGFEVIHGPYKKYYQGGKIIEEEGTYFSKWIDKECKIGECKYYYKNGNLKHIVVYKLINEMEHKSVWDGTVSTYYETGELLRTVNFTEGEFSSPLTIYEKDGSIKYNDPEPDETYDNHSYFFHLDSIENVKKDNTIEIIKI